MFKFPLKENFRWTTNYDQPRPLSRPIEQRNRKHAAADWLVQEDTPFFAPEGGSCVWFWLDRDLGVSSTEIEEVQYRGDAEGNLVSDTRLFPYRNYFSDVWGGLTIFYGFSGNTYLFAHCNKDRIINASKQIKQFTERARGGKIVYHTNKDNPVTFKTGQLIGYSGNSGASTAPHIHLELHKGRNWTRHNERENPENMWSDVWQEHRHEVLNAKDKAYW